MIPKRYLFGIISLLIIIASACEKKENTPTCSYPKNAKLKRIVNCGYIETDCPTKECDDIVRIEKEYEYDSKGRLEWELFHPKGEYLLYKYNSKDQLAKIEYYGEYKDDNLPYQIITYTYSDDGKKIKENIEYVNSNNQYKLYKYSDNRLTRIDIYEESDELNDYILDDYILLEYDDSGNLVKEAVYNYDGVLRYNIQHEFENGLNVRTYENGNEFVKTYDENDNLVFLEEFRGAGSSKTNAKFKYEYFY